MIKILETLYKEDGWITLSELSSDVHASVRTVAEDISSLRKQWGQELNIECSKKSGVRLLSRNVSGIGLVFNRIFNQSVAMRWIKELLFSPNETSEFYENRLFVSRSTLSRLLPKINLFLSTREMSIRCENNRYQFIGADEQYLRDFSASFLIELYGPNLEKAYIDVDYAAIADIILSAMAKNLEPDEFTCFSSDDVSVSYYIMFYVVSLMRENHGFTAVSDYPVEKEIDSGMLAYIRKLFPSLGPDNLRPIHEFMFRQYNGWTSAAEKELVARETESFISRLLSSVPVLTDGDERYKMSYIMRSLYLNTKLRHFKTSLLFDRVYYFSQSVKRSNPFLYEVIEKDLAIFSRSVNSEMSEKLSSAIFWLCLVCPQLCRYSSLKTALLIDDFGSQHASFLKKFLSDCFGRENFCLIKIDIAPYPDIPDEETLKGYDFLMTTVPNLQVSHKLILHIDDYPSYGNLFDIYKVLMD